MNDRTPTRKDRKKSPAPSKEEFTFWYKTNASNVKALDDNFSKRRWKSRYCYEYEWHLYWAIAPVTDRLFTASGKPISRFRDTQIFNHFPKSVELARKDSLALHIQRYREKLEREHSPLAVKTAEIDAHYYDLGGTNYVYLNFLPLTFMLPKEYNEVVDEFKKQPRSTWIVKPSAGSEGQGIRLINSTIKSESWESLAPSSQQQRHDTSYVISRYIENPYLIEGKKFDLRLYVLLTSLTPFKAYLYKEGFCRLSSQLYSLDRNTIEDNLVHLTNSSVQGKEEEHKWPLTRFFEYLIAEKSTRKEESIMQEIKEIIVHSLLSVKDTLVHDPHCFELYGYDILLDNNLKSWLIEVNTAPNLNETSDADREMKTRLVDDVLNVILPPSGIPDVRWDKNPKTVSLNNFHKLSEHVIWTRTSRTHDYRRPS